MPKLINRVGQKFGKLEVIKRIGTTTSKKPLWECICECGSKTNVDSCSLVTGNTGSCGCYLKEKITKHGGSKNASYNTWRSMMRRCYKPQDKDYSRYGGKGVKVCEHWHEYSNFVADMGEPAGDETLDRKDTYGDYTLDNCRWAGVKTQNRNLRIRGNSKTGVTGVSKTNSGSYMAKITVGKHSFYSSCFKTLEEAVAARKELEIKHWNGR